MVKWLCKLDNIAIYHKLWMSEIDTGHIWIKIHTIICLFESIWEHLHKIHMLKHKNIAREI